MTSEKKKKLGSNEQREKRDGVAAGTASSSSKWRGPLLIAMAALCVSRGLQYHRYWNSLSPMVETRQGPLQGRSARTDSGREYFAFQGIPYAKPPLGPLRFLDPQPPESWGPEVRDARAEGSVCMQPGMQFPGQIPLNMSVMDVVRVLGAVPAVIHRTIKIMRQSEDCLFLNVFTPKVGRQPSEPLPVLFYIHGGAFVYGDSGIDIVGPKYLMEHDVILVTINYRLGLFGFLSLEEVGNAGLKDVVAALRWVRDNIANFGGDPGKVTVVGQSAGGALAHYLTLVPSSKGLFHSVICMSGTALHHWAYSSPEQARTRTDVLIRQMARKTGYAGGDQLRFLQEVDASVLADPTNFSELEVEREWLMDEFPFQPSVDGSFLTAAPLELIRAGRAHQVPIMLGLTAREGLFFYPSSMVKNRTMEQQAAAVDADFWLALPEYMRQALPRGSAGLQRASSAVRDFYFNKGVISSDSLQQFIDFYGVLMFDYDMHRLSKELAVVSSAPVYVYNFTFEGRINMFRRSMLYHVSDVKGATHCDELNYLFDIDVLPYVPLIDDDPEISLRKTILQLFVNFVKFGNPTPVISSEIPIKWQPVTKNSTPVLNINLPLRLQEGIRKADTSLWDNLYHNIAKN